MPKASLLCYHINIKLVREKQIKLKESILWHNHKKWFYMLQECHHRVNCFIHEEVLREALWW